MNEMRDECGALREGIARFAVGASDAEERAAIETHVARCARCASELAALRAAGDALARWSEPHDEADPRDLARIAIEAARERARRRRRVALAAAAGLAGIALFALFALGGARARLADGGLELAFGRAELADRGETERALAELETRHAEAIDALRGEFARERAAFLDAFDRARAADREVVAAELERVARGAAMDTAETRGALLDLVAYVAKRDAP